MKIGPGSVGRVCGARVVDKPCPWPAAFWGALSDFVALLKKTQCPHLVIGGVAFSLHGQPRTTQDIDGTILLPPERWSEFLQLAQAHQFSARRPDALAFARKSRVLLLRHQPSGIGVDISFAALPFEEEAFARRHLVTIDTLEIPIPSVEDLIIMKAVAHRPVDRADIDTLIRLHSTLDATRIRYWVKEFAAVLEVPEIYTDIDRLLTSDIPRRRTATTKAARRNTKRHTRTR